MTEPLTSGILGAIGVGEASEQVYRLVLRYPGHSLESLCDRLGCTIDDLRRDLVPLVDQRLVRLVDGAALPEPPEFALGRLVNAESRRLAEAQDALGTARDEINAYVAEHIIGQRADWQPISIDVVPAAELADVMQTLIANGTGELLFLRPDQWYLPTGRRVDVAVTAALGSGRASRVIYPATITETTPPLVLERALAGERVRVLPEVPTRLAILGSDAVIVPEIWGATTGSRLLIRQPAIVAACTAYFDLLWNHAVTVPFGADTDPGPRRQLLELLARGAKDEQIARALGLSLRTIRRRIADLLAELGVDSRFQAGMEAVRRGWL